MLILFIARAKMRNYRYMKAKSVHIHLRHTNYTFDTLRKVRKYVMKMSTQELIIARIIYVFFTTSVV